MKSIARLDFMAHPPRPWSGAALMALAAALVCAAGISCWQIEQHNRDARALLNQRAARLAAPPPRKLTEAERLRLVQAASVLGQLRAPWADLLATFEAHGRAEIGLLKLEPDARTGVVRVTGHARNPQALFSYLRDLEADARLQQVFLTTHQNERDTPGQPLRFTIQAGWRSAPVVATGSS